MTNNSLTIGLALSGIALTFGGCGLFGGGGGNGDGVEDCEFLPDGTADPSDTNCYCEDGSLVVQGGDCECDTSNPDDPDCDFCDYPANADDPDCTSAAQVDPFVPANLGVSGDFGYNADTMMIEPWIFDGQPIPPYIELEFSDARFRDTRNNAFRCTIALMAPSDEKAAEVLSYTYSNDNLGQPSQDFVHLAFILEGGQFEVMDLPQDNAQGGRIPGCIEVENDPLRGFGEFFGGSIEEWVNAYDWGAGFGNLATHIEDLIVSDITSLQEPLERGEIIGMTYYIFAENPEGDDLDFKIPLGFSYGFEVESNMSAVVDGESFVFLHESSMVVDPELVTGPVSGRYIAANLYVLGFGG